jgi:hypothetical protein
MDLERRMPARVLAQRAAAAERSAARVALNTARVAHPWRVDALNTAPRRRVDAHPLRRACTCAAAAIAPALEALVALRVPRAAAALALDTTRAVLSIASRAAVAVAVGAPAAVLSAARCALSF